MGVSGSRDVPRGLVWCCFVVMMQRNICLGGSEVL